MDTEWVARNSSGIGALRCHASGAHRRLTTYAVSALKPAHELLEGDSETSYYSSSNAIRVIVIGQADHKTVTELYDCNAIHRKTRCRDWRHTTATVERHLDKRVAEGIVSVVLRI